MKFKLEIRKEHLRVELQKINRMTILFLFFFVKSNLSFAQEVINLKSDSCMTVYYQNTKNKQFEYCIKEGQFDGVYKSYYRNGNIEKEGVFNKGIKHGIWTYYYDNGQKSRQGNYNKDRKNGIWMYWDENKNLFSSGKYNNDQKDSIWIQYYPNGKVESYGEFVISKQPDYKGKSVCSSKNVYSVKSGIWKEYYSDGELKNIGLFLPKAECLVEKEIDTMIFLSLK